MWGVGPQPPQSRQFLRENPCDLSCALQKPLSCSYPTSQLFVQLLVSQRSRRQSLKLAEAYRPSASRALHPTTIPETPLQPGIVLGRRAAQGHLSQLGLTRRFGNSLLCARGILERPQVG